MDWSRIKTIFILTFLVLNIYLVYQFMNTRDAAQYEIIKEASLEEKLKNDSIRYPELPETKKERYISVRTKVFKNEELDKTKGQVIDLGDGTSIEAKLAKPIKLSSKFEPAELSGFIKSNIFSGEQYKFWKKDDETKTITYYQQYDNKTFYYNSNARLTLYVNENNEVVSYRQTYLEVIDEQLSDEEELLTPLRAMETLYKKGLLKPKSEITKVELGYSTLVSLTASHVVTPTWRLVLDGKENLFVHAFEGRVIPLTDGENQTTE